LASWCLGFVSDLRFEIWDFRYETRSFRARKTAGLPRRLFVLSLWAILCLVLLGCGGDGGSKQAPEVLGCFGRTGSGDGEFMYPRAVALAADGSVWVIDKTGRVQHFAPEGTFLSAFPMPQVEVGKPTGLAVGPEGNLYVADTHYHRVLVFTPGGKIVREIGKLGEGNGCFIYPTHVAFAPDGRIFVSEYGGNDRISIFSAEGVYLSSFGSLGGGEGQLSRPAAMAVDAARGRLYVADACNHRIAAYDLAGRCVGYFGSIGDEKGQLRYPYGLSLLADGSLAVSEFGNNRVQVFSPEGKALGLHGRAGRSLGELAYPWGVAVGPHGRAYVVDAGNNRVQIWHL
jgi:DNA-binding beta-propeller fold protein YncE